MNKTKLQEFLHKKEDDLVWDIDTIEKIVTNHIDIIPKICVPDIKLKFSYDTADLVKIDQFLNTMHQYSFETTDKEEVKKLLNDSFLVENSWI